MNPPISARRQSAGFSLLEVLVALAITSIISALIFSSLTTQVTQADVIRRSTQDAFESVTSRRLAELVVARTIPAWADEPEAQFSGSREEFAGSAAVDLFGRSEGLQKYRLSLRPEGAYSWLDVEVGDKSWSTLRFPVGAKFRYLGPSGTWRDSWPAPVPSATSLELLESELMDVGLPSLISVWDAASERQLGLELRLQNSGALPVRARDLVSDAPP